MFVKALNTLFLGLITLLLFVNTQCGHEPKEIVATTPAQAPAPTALPTLSDKIFLKAEKQDTLFRVKQFEVNAKTGDTIILIRPWADSSGFRKLFFSKVEKLYADVAKYHIGTVEKAATIGSYKRFVSSLGLGNYSDYMKEKLQSRFDGIWTFQAGALPEILVLVDNLAISDAGTGKPIGEISPQCGDFFTLILESKQAVDMYRTPGNTTDIFKGYDNAGNLYKIAFSKGS